MGFLTDVTTAARRRLEARPLDDVVLMARALAMPPPRDLEGALGADGGGVNARDLETFEIDVGRALALLRRIPKGRVRLMESVISRRADVEEAAAAGASAILVGEALMRAGDPVEKLRELRGEETSR